MKHESLSDTCFKSFAPVTSSIYSEAPTPMRCAHCRTLVRQNFENYIPQVAISWGVLKPQTSRNTKIRTTKEIWFTYISLVRSIPLTLLLASSIKPQTEQNETRNFTAIFRVCDHQNVNTEGSTSSPKAHFFL